MLLACQLKISFFLKAIIATPRKPMMCAVNIPAACSTPLKFCIELMMASLSADTLTSKKPFQPIMYVVKRNGLMALKTGISRVLKIVNIIMTLIVATIGPMEFSAKTDNKKASAATVNIATAAKAKAAM